MQTSNISYQGLTCCKFIIIFFISGGGGGGGEGGMSFPIEITMAPFILILGAQVKAR